jgi:RNA polymerase sigma-70 factor (ECF subfamily)
VYPDNPAERAAAEIAAANLAVTRVYNEHGRAMWALAARLLRDNDAADDVVQEALVRVWKHPEVLTNGRGSLRGWLSVTVTNLVRDRMRRPESREVPLSPTTVHEAAPRPGAEPTDLADRVADLVDTAALLLPATDQLTDTQRAALEHLYVRDQSTAMAAEQLGVSRSTVQRWSYDGLHALRTELNVAAEGTSS